MRPIYIMLLIAYMATKLEAGNANNVDFITNVLGQELPEANKSLIHRMSDNYTSVTKSTTRVNYPKDGKFSAISTTKKRNNNYMTMSTSGDGKTAGAKHAVRSMNDNYYFVLDRNRDDSNWLLVRIESFHDDASSGTSKEVSGFKEAALATSRSLLNLPLRAGHTAPDKISGLPGFKLIQKKRIKSREENI